MGFWDKVKEAEKEAHKRNKAEIEAWRIGKPYPKDPVSEKKLRKKKEDYHPSKEKDGLIRADIYSTYGTHDLDKWFEQGAPHLTNAIYQIRDDVKRQQIRYQNQYEDLKKNYEELKTQYDNLTKMITDLSKNGTRQ